MHSSSLSCAGTSKAHSLPASSQPIPINIPMFYATHRISNVLYCSIIYHLESKNHTYVLHVIHICLKITYVYAYICLCLCHMHSCLFISIYMSYSYEFIVNIIIIIHVLASPRIWEQPQFIAMFSHSSHELWSSVMLYKVLGIGMKKHMEKNTYRSPFPPWKRNYSNCKNKALISMYFPFELPEKLWSSIVFFEIIEKKKLGILYPGEKMQNWKKQ